MQLDQEPAVKKNGEPQNSSRDSIGYDFERPLHVAMGRTGGEKRNNQGVRGVIGVEETRLAGQTFAAKRATALQLRRFGRSPRKDPIQAVVSDVVKEHYGAAAPTPNVDHSGVHVGPERRKDFDVLLSSNPLRKTVDPEAEEWRCDYCDHSFASFIEAEEHERGCTVFLDFDPMREQEGKTVQMAIAPGRIDDLDYDADEDALTSKQVTWAQFLMRPQTLTTLVCFLATLILVIFIASPATGDGGVSEATGGYSVLRIIQNVEMRLTRQDYHTVRPTLEAGYGLVLGVAQKGPGSNFIFAPGAEVDCSMMVVRRTSSRMWVTFEAAVRSDAKINVNVTANALAVDVQTLSESVYKVGQVLGTASSLPPAGQTFMAALSITEITDETLPTAAPTSPPTFAPDITRAPTAPTATPTAYPTTIPTVASMQSRFCLFCGFPSSISD